MKNNCKEYTLDCKCEEMGCKGCAYNKTLAMGDMTYCVNDECKNKCDRHTSKHVFSSDVLYSFCEFKEDCPAKEME